MENFAQCTKFVFVNYCLEAFRQQFKKKIKQRIKAQPKRKRERKQALSSFYIYKENTEQRYRQMDKKRET